MASKRYKLKCSAMWAAVKGTPIRGITAMDDLINVFHNDRSGIYIVFKDFIIVFEHLLYYIHETIMKQRKAKNKPLPLKIEGQGS